MQIRKGFECQFANEIRSILWMQILTIEKDSKHSNANSNHSKGIQVIRNQIWSIRTRFEAFECKFEPSKGDSISKFKPIEQD